MNRIVEFYGESVIDESVEWDRVTREQNCPFTSKKCFKIRKSSPEISIGTCTISHSDNDMIICPNRLLERNQAFFDCICLLDDHKHGNELHVIREVPIPGGILDYVLVTSNNGVVEDFIGIEFQTMDTTGTVWGERQRLLIDLGVVDVDYDNPVKKSFGMNWKMTAKTTLMQIHHKANTFNRLGKKLVLIVQKPFLEYMQSQFDFSCFRDAEDSDPIHIHSYVLNQEGSHYRIRMDDCISTDLEGMTRCLAPYSEESMDPEEFANRLISKASSETLLVRR